MSVIIHEVAHGYSAYLLGDNTAQLSGRLTLNPLKHLDPFGSVILPLLLIIMNAGFVIGWARPVPYNPANLRKGRFGNFIVAGAGIVANLALAIIFGLIIRFAPGMGLPLYNVATNTISPFYIIVSKIVEINLILALFNIIPIPPLDGSKILFSFLPSKLRYVDNLSLEYCFSCCFYCLFFYNRITLENLINIHINTIISN
jgi:Zn-dependent protease